mgnify:CR=1 FL=1
MNTTDILPAKDFETITVSTTALMLNSSKVHAAERAVVQVQAQSIRVRWDGGTPTDTIGFLYAANSIFAICGQENMAKLRMIRVSSDATVVVTYEGLR